MFAFADLQIIELAKTHFVPACADDWYQRRCADAEGVFWKAICSQGPRPADATTHQGIYLLTADGELLAFKNSGHDAKSTRKLLKEGLEKWNGLPFERRRPGAVAVLDHGPLDPNYTRTPPQGGLVVRVRTRILDKNADGYVKGACDFAGGDRSVRLPLDRGRRGPRTLPGSSYRRPSNRIPDPDRRENPPISLGR